MSELKLAAKRLDSGKAPGPDGIPNEVLRATIREKPQLILDLLNTYLEIGHFPKQCKRQKLVLISKTRRMKGYRRCNADSVHDGAL